MDAASHVLATTKTPTTPEAPALAALDGAQSVLATSGVGWEQVSTFIHGTTLATNALIERRGARVATITTAGFRDILEIAYERRYSQYAINIEKPDLIVPRKHALTIGGRMNAQGGEIAPLDEASAVALAEALRGEDIEALAICLMHAYANPAHEQRLRALLATELPDLPLRHAPEAVDLGHRQFAAELVFSGGTGARPTLDGLSATAFPSGVWGSQVETTEAAAPVLIHARELRADSGGVGQYRGGLGQHIEISSAIDEDILLFLSVEHVDNPAKGRHGGLDGAKGRIRIGMDGPDLPSKGEFRIPTGKVLIFETRGGGGFGPPERRSREAVMRDVGSGMVSNAVAETVYGGTS
ncbi:hydantoinase/oxoprolinase N-terminal domain-containing protein [Roseovarius carneus]|uniref:hydantoinase/oxoprolinase N-terminal domain-containing protein n=1 Tax=Roseovarius carneus TaxID=2853164 RepID=UPI001CCA67E4|nr:hydantoinase/oxoprolinase N-terminal domain-containing protein [Roseovarius carneus]